MVERDERERAKERGGEIRVEKELGEMKVEGKRQ